VRASFSPSWTLPFWVSTVPEKSHRARSGTREKQLLESAIAAAGGSGDWLFWQERRRRAEATAEATNRARLMIHLRYTGNLAERYPPGLPVSRKQDALAFFSPCAQFA
jgi:hypothetical protein